MRLYRDDPEELDIRAALHVTEGPAAALPAPGEAAALLGYIRKGVRTVSGVRAPLKVVRRTRTAFNVRRRYASGAQAEAFQYMLDRLQALNLIAWERLGSLIHVVASKEGGKLRQ
jgi:hypothetical protein